MTLRDILSNAQKLAQQNSPAILTAIGVTGTITTALLASKASFKAANIIRDEQFRLNANREAGQKQHELDRKEKAKLVWTLYIPAVATGAATCAAIVFANRIGTKRAAAYAAAYSISERAYSEYKDKVIEEIGKAKEQKIRDEVAQDRVNANPVGNQQVIITGGGEVLCMDARSGRYFTSDMETMKKAQNDANHKAITQDYVSLTEFYSKLGLGPTKESDNLGWGCEELIELTFSTTMSDDQRPCLVMDFRRAPREGYFLAHR